MQQNSTQDKLLNALLFVGGGIGLYFAVRSISRTQSQTNAFTNPNINAQVAARLLAAINPSGFEFMIGMDGTDEDAIFSAIQAATSYKQVSRFYAQMTRNRILGNDLRNELSDTDLQRFQRIISTKP